MAKRMLCLASLATVLVLTHSMTTARTNTSAADAQTTTKPKTECELGRIRLDGLRNRYQQLTQDVNQTDVWLVMQCPNPDLIFNFQACACVNPPAPICPYRPIDGNNRRYQEVLFPYTNFTCRVRNTFWNSSGCQCDWDPNGPRAPALPDISSCHPIFQATFDLGDNGGVRAVPYKPVRVTTGDGAKGGALEIEPDTDIIASKMAYTSFGRGLIINFRFRSRIDPSVNDEFVALVTNGCENPETFSISYQASSRIYDVSLLAIMLPRRSRNFMRFRCQDKSSVVDGYQWNTVSFIMTTPQLTLLVNDVECHSQPLEPARPPTSRCPMVLGGDRRQNDRRRPKLKGFIDEISVRRYCTRRRS